MERLVNTLGFSYVFSPLSTFPIHVDLPSVGGNLDFILEMYKKTQHHGKTLLNSFFFKDHNLGFHPREVLLKGD